MKKLIRKVLIIMGIILLLFVLIKLYHFVIVKNMFDAIDEFRNEENRAYFVNTVIDGDAVLEEKVLLKEDIIKYINRISGSEVRCKYRNFENNQEYSFCSEKKEVYMNDLTIQNRDVLYSLPAFMELKDIKLKLKLSQINYIIPIKYNDKFCYKIVTRKEEVIIESSTYLPIYSSVKRVRLDDKTKIEKTYEFKIGEVTDEDVALPDLSEYTIVE